LVRLGGGGCRRGVPGVRVAQVGFHRDADSQFSSSGSKPAVSRYGIELG
jgi:hypothetical protein